jgi:Fur family ferric uptake transcriptional regulator
MSHGDVADRLASQAWDRATIYRNLTDLAEAGLVRRTDVGDHVWRFEALRQEHDSSHPHFVCTECGVVECLPEIELAVRRAKAPRAVKQRQVEVHVRGLCDACR